jgi:predicted dehydrogenase
MRKVRWGVLSTARIGVQKVIPAMQQCSHGEIVAIASRKLAAAQQAASKLGIAKAYGTYEELLADDDIDAVYNPTPNHLHVPLSIKALETGKHVLCEKPIALTAEEASRLLLAAKAQPRLKVMEAFMYRHHPQWQKARALAQSGQIGIVKTMHCFFSFYNDDPANTRNQAELGGGALLDIGCYAVSIPRFIFGAEPRRVCALRELDPRFHTDRLISGMIDFGEAAATFTCSTQLLRAQTAMIMGTEGRIKIEVPLNPPLEKPARIFHFRGEAVDEITFAPCNQFTLQGDLFNAAILDDTPVPTPLDDAAANMKALDALSQSAEQNAWVQL